MKLALALAFAVLAAPVAAAEADVAFLQKLSGNWTGSAQLSGEETGKVQCRLSMKPNGPRLNYSGRCSVPGQGGQSFQGVIAYNDAAKRYEARSAGDTAVGKRSGSTLTFSFNGKNIQGSVNSTMRFSPNAIRVDFRMVNGRTKGVTTAQIPFSKG